MIKTRFAGWPVAATALLLLAGCGISTPISSLMPGGEEPTFYQQLDAKEARVDESAARDMISLYRRNNGRGMVIIDPGLVKVAQTQALAMARANNMSPTVDGDLRARLDRQGVPHRAAVENISAGYHTLAEAFSGWRQSPHHNENMLDSGVHKMGIATAYAPGSKYKVFWALVMTD